LTYLSNVFFIKKMAAVATVAAVAEKHPLGVESSTPSDPEIASTTGEPVEETYGIETPERNKLFKWAYLLDEKVGALGRHECTKTDTSTDLRVPDWY
jgi:hypothetical protein